MLNLMRKAYKRGTLTPTVLIVALTIVAWFVPMELPLKWLYTVVTILSVVATFVDAKGWLNK